MPAEAGIAARDDRVRGGREEADMARFACAFGAFLVAVGVPSSAPAQVIERVSVSSAGVEGDGESVVVGGRRVVSADGRWVVFTSSATNLVPDDGNGVSDVFVRDRWLEATSRVSVDLAGGDADGPSFDASISADGRWVVFTSAATDLVAGDRNWEYDVFVRDLWLAQTVRASVTPTGGDPGDDSGEGSISADGRWVAFVTWARQLAPGDTDWGGPRDVIVRDMERGESVLATVAADGGEAEEAGWEAAIAGDGRRVAFVSNADNLVQGDANTWMDAFVRDLDAAVTMRVSVDAEGGDPDNRTRHPRLSDDGRWVTVWSFASDFVVGDTNGQADVFLRDLTRGLTTRVNLATGGAQSVGGGCWYPDISGDGRYVAYLSDATNLYPDDDNGFGDILGWDRVTGVTTLLSTDPGGGQVDGWSNQPSLSVDGRYVVFESIATDMVPGDTNGVWDVFIARGPAPGPHLAVPAVARAQGAGAFFTSRVDALNSSDRPLTAEVVFTARADIGLPMQTATLRLEPGEMVSVDDPLATWFGIQSTGAVGSLAFTVTDGRPEALEVQSVVLARNDDGSEYGQFFPASAQGLHAGEIAYLPTTADPWRTRVNFGAMGLVDGTRVEVRPVGPIGTTRAPSRIIQLDRGVSAQLNDVFGAQVFDLGTPTDVLLEVAVTAGSAVVYGSVLDGRGATTGTNDPTTIRPVRRGAERVTLLEIGSAQGVDEFSGSATISNLSPEPVTVQADLHLRGQPGAAQSTQITLAAGETQGYGDIVQHLFTRSDVGTVVFTARDGGRIAVTGREYSVERDQQGEVVATAGQLIPGMTDDEQLQPHRRYHLLGLRQRQTDAGLERSHVAAFNPGDGDVRVELEMYDGATGARDGATTLTVRAGELIQLNNVVGNIDGEHGGGVKRLAVSVSGEVFLKAFRVNANGDPVTIDAVVE